MEYETDSMHCNCLPDFNIERLRCQERGECGDGLCLAAELPSELQRSAEDSAEGRSVYTRADGAYEVVIETAAGSPDAVLRQLTGREAAALDPVYLAWPQADQYQFAWTGADDEGELACCGTLLYDGTTCYTLTIRCAAELEKTYHAEFARILAHTRLTDAA